MDSTRHGGGTPQEITGYANKDPAPLGEPIGPPMRPSIATDPGCGGASVTNTISSPPRTIAHLLIHRSWIGTCVFIAPCKASVVTSFARDALKNVSEVEQIMLVY